MIGEEGVGRGEEEVCGGGLSLCVDLCGRRLLVDGLLPQIVAALVLLLHAVDEEEGEEDGEHQTDGAACDQSWRTHTRWKLDFCLKEGRLE